MQYPSARSVALNLLLATVVITVLFKGGKSLESVWLLGLVSVLVTIVMIPDAWKRPQISAKHIVLGLFTLWTIISFLFSSTQNYGLDEVFQSVSLFLIYSALTSLDQNHRSEFLQRFVKVIGVVTLIACAIGILVYTFQPVSRFVGTFYDYRFHTDYWPNAWAEFLLFAWPIIVWKIVTSERKFHWFIRSLVIGFILGCFLLSYSRGGILSAILQLGIGAAFLFFWKAPRFLSAQIATLSLLIGLFFFTSINHIRSYRFNTESVIQKATFTADERKSSVSERSQFWRQSLELIGDKPVTGFGSYSFRFIQPKLQTAVLATSDHPHNVFLKYAVERGIPAALLFFIFVFLIARDAVSRLRSDTQNRFLTLALSLSCLGVLAHNLIDFNLQFAGIALPLMITCGLLSKNHATRSSTSRTMTVVSAIFAIGLFVFLIIEGQYLVISSKGRKAEARGDAIAAIHYYAQANNQIFSRDMLLSHATLLRDAKRYEEADRVIDQYLGLNAQDGRAHRIKADVLLISGDIENAIESYKTAYQWNRYNDLSSVIGYIDVLYTNTPDELNGMEAELLELVKAYESAIRFNEHFIALSQNVEALVKLNELLIEIYPQHRTELQKVSEDAMKKAAEERSKLIARPSGVLW